MRDDPFAGLTLPPFATVLGHTGDHVEHGCFSIICGALLQGHDGPLGLTVGLDSRQIRYWLPFDHPRFDEISAIIRRASDRNERLELTVCPEERFILEVEETRVCRA
jgi:hypothetical protein